MQRTNVYADPEDLAAIKVGAARLGVSEAEIIRRGIHIAALSVRDWDEPFFSEEEIVHLGGGHQRTQRHQAYREATQRKGDT
jgi:hypothetical protein